VTESSAPGDPSAFVRPRPIDLVPRDPFAAVRTALLCAYAIGYVVWFRTQGLLIDRISVAISVGIFLVCAFIGRPLRRWAILAFDALAYCAMWFVYDMTRGAADHLGMPVQVQAPRNIDRWLFLGTDPSAWLQRHFYDRRHVHWYDRVGSLVYYSHFVVPIAVIAILWAADRREWARYMRRFASVLGVACLLFVLLPTVPPWMATSVDRRFHYRLFAPLARPTGRGFVDLGFKGFVKSWQGALDWTNQIAAMPSLHAAFALFTPAFFLPRISRRWLRVLVLTYPAAMLLALVYFAEHWVIDGFVGWAMVGASFWMWARWEQRRRRVLSDRARGVLDPSQPALTSTEAPVAT
jgi:hypothetical protein